VLADHQAAIDGPAPSRVVQGWLIAVSFLQGSDGCGESAASKLVDGDQTVPVL
jgi:hypothetical protein